MSIEAIQWAFKAKVKSSLKLLLVAMADHVNANNGHDVWPSISSLEEKTSMDRKTIMSSLEKLKELGFISETGKKAGKTGRVNVYRLNIGNSTKNGTVSPVDKPVDKPVDNYKTVPETALLNDTKNGTVDGAEIVPNFPGTVPKTGQLNSTKFGTWNLPYRTVKESSNKQFSRAKPNPVAVQISIALRKNKIDSNPADPRLIALAEQGVSVETVEAACQDALRRKPNERVSVGYVVAILETWRQQAAGMNVSGAKKPESKSEKDQRWLDELTGRNRRKDDEYRTIDSEARVVG